MQLPDDRINNFLLCNTTLKKVFCFCFCFFVLMQSMIKIDFLAYHNEPFMS